MNSEDEFREAMAALLGNVKDVSERIKQYSDDVSVIAAYCREIPIVKENEQKTRDAYSDMTSVELWKQLIYKVAQAPTQIHAMVSSKMLIPLLDEKLSEESSNA